MPRGLLQPLADPSPRDHIIDYADLIPATPHTLWALDTMTTPPRAVKYEKLYPQQRS